MRKSVRALLQNSFSQIGYCYDQLSEVEKSLVTEAEFVEVCDELRGTAKLSVSVGDWVRFYRNGTIVTGVVLYILGSTHTRHPQLCTDVGTVTVNDVLEVRHP